MYKIDYLPKQSFLIYVIFISILDCCFRWLEFNNTLLYQNEGGGEQPQEHQHPCPILLTFCPPLCKNQKKPEVDKKSQACEETLTLTKGFVFSSCKCSKQSVSCLLTLTQSEHFIWSGCFQICSGNNNTLLHAYEVIHLIKKDMFRSRVKYF